MPSPILVPVENADTRITEGLPPLAAGRALFRVAREGHFGGLAFAAGDLLVCDGDARHGDTVVLVARGHGRPRLGAVRGVDLLGDAGERCHRARWRPAGKLLAVARRRQGRWVVAVPEGAPRPPAQLLVAPCQGQLSLFEAAA